MKCQDYREILSARLDGEVAIGESSRVDSHLQGCADCRRYLADCIALREKLQDWPDEIPARAIRPGPVSAPGWWFLRVPRLAAAAILLVTLIVGFLVGRVSAPEPVETVEESPEGFFVATKTVYPERNEIHYVAVLTSVDPSKVKVDK